MEYYAIRYKDTREGGRVGESDGPSYCRLGRHQVSTTGGQAVGRVDTNVVVIVWEREQELFKYMQKTKYVRDFM